MMHMDIAITGSTGLIGSALTEHLSATGHNVVGITRSGSEGIHWDPAAGEIDAMGLEGIDGVVHLAGESIGEHRWNAATKAAIMDSRVKGTTLLATTLANLAKPPSVLLSGSAIGYYGSRGDEVLTERSPEGGSFVSDVAVAWEAATAPAEAAGIRVSHLRTGIVLSAKGGALAKILRLFKLGLGGRLGNGRQYWSTISMEDEVGLIAWLLNADLSGPVNLTCPEPTTNAVFTKTLGTVLGRPTFMAVPTFAPKLLLGSELANALLFASARVLPQAATEHGYQFVHPNLEAALRGALA